MFNVTVHASVAVHVHLSGLSALADAVPTILASNEEVRAMVSQLAQDFQAALAEDTNANNAIVTLVNGIVDKLEEVIDDKAAMQEVLAGFRANSKQMADLATANTPAAPPATDPPVDTPTDPGADTAAGGEGG